MLPVDKTPVRYRTDDYHGLYGREKEVYEVRVGDSQWVNMYRLPYSVLHELGAIEREFGLTVEARKTKEYKTPKKKTPNPHTYENVMVKEFSGHPEAMCLVGMKVENRAVYTNSNGPYIKTRSAGRVPVQPVKDESDTPLAKYVVRYLNGRVVDAHGTRITR